MPADSLLMLQVFIRSNLVYAEIFANPTATMCIFSNLLQTNSNDNFGKGEVLI